MSAEKLFMGIDIGSVSISLILIDDRGNVIDTQYETHHGRKDTVLSRLLEKWKDIKIAGTGIASGKKEDTPRLQWFDPRICVITGARDYFPDLGSLLDVGGEKFSLTLFDSGGNYRRARSNTSCAAGTGGFLDQQARRLGLENSSALADLALKNRGSRPKIASRCSVFAKTDLIHAQQEGYNLEEICAGLCFGLAENLRDTLFPDNNYSSPVVFTGGAALNGGVVQGLEALLGEKLLIHPLARECGALGAALLSAKGAGRTGKEYSPADLIPELDNSPGERAYHFPPLELKLSDYPDFKSLLHYDYIPEKVSSCPAVETDLYFQPEPEESGNVPVYLGIDIGSTSTKAALLDREGKTIAGFYTRTGGRPIIAFRGILEALNDLEKRRGIDFRIIGAGTTGSGRKFLGAIAGADIILDEISAHARAARELDPEIDTIIEIGGQDSKFTTLNNGMVTFSQMNTVCAAGTGSFIEEQAGQLGVPLSQYAERAMNARAPRASDRCTVFMERDIHHYLNLGYEIDEILAAVLYSVRENYLQKVASTGSMGKKICFQGATAKNRALVAAFEEKLKVPLHVSPYCHLTGAIGTALTVKEEIGGKTGFRGKDLYLNDIPVRNEQCNLCGNHCRLRVAEVNGETAAFGFMCGRDYHTKHYVKLNSRKSLLQTRREIKNRFFPIHGTGTKIGAGTKEGKEKTVGIPLALQLTEEQELWQSFFSALNIPVRTSTGLENPVKRGKALAEAEFCTPIHALYGHVDYTADICDVLFLPHYLEKERKPGPENVERIRKYCYYTQFAPTLALTIRNIENRAGVMRPVVRNNQDIQKTAKELHLHMNKELNGSYTLREIETAYRKAVSRFRDYEKALAGSFYNGTEDTDRGEQKDIRIALLGRPYSVLDGNLNSGIPEIIAELGIRALFTDQIPPAEYEESEMGSLLSAFHWNYASSILRATLRCARTRGLYPVLVTSFKCAPDSFLIEYFKRIMNRYEKPYLILQLDEHDSNVGYETRIEAGVRAFRNHAEREDGTIPFPGSGITSYTPELTQNLRDKTIFLPNWDPMAIPLIAASLNNLGYRTRVLEETDDLIRESMSMNTGQCIPVNVIAHEYMKTIREEGLKPEETTLWMVKCQWACNIHLYPYYIKSLLETEGMEKANVFWGEITYIEFSTLMTIRAYVAYFLSGILRKIGCALRPFEVDPGSTDRQIEKAWKILLEAFRKDAGYLEATRKIKLLFDNIALEPGWKPKVAVFGDLYIRDNPVINQDLIRSIERNGGEAVITPYNDYVKIIAGTYFDKWKKEKRYGDYFKFKGILTVMELMEKSLHKPFDNILGKPFQSGRGSATEALEAYSVRLEQEGESIENLLKIIHLMKEHRDLSLLVQANPAFCCPSLVTEAMGSKIEELTGIPMVTLTYDGTGSPKNDVIIPYLKFAAERRRTQVPGSLPLSITSRTL